MRDRDVPARQSPVRTMDEFFDIPTVLVIVVLVRLTPMSAASADAGSDGDADASPGGLSPVAS